MYAPLDKENAIIRTSAFTSSEKKPSVSKETGRVSAFRTGRTVLLRSARKNAVVISELRLRNAMLENRMSITQRDIASTITFRISFFIPEFYHAVFPITCILIISHNLQTITQSCCMG